MGPVASRDRLVRALQLAPAMLAVSIAMFLALHMLWDLLKRRVGIVASLLIFTACIIVIVVKVEVEEQVEAIREEEMEQIETDLRVKRRERRKWADAGCEDEESYLEQQREVSREDMLRTMERLSAMREHVRGFLDSVNAEEDDTGDVDIDAASSSSAAESDIPTLGERVREGMLRRRGGPQGS
mmetsp:Transcript_31344/g.57491  ORF Transcript_31344/g.57491 Transcript_31344/m.57491 type:complete len:184 (+) Transcript_31344:104-655(+)